MITSLVPFIYDYQCGNYNTEMKTSLVPIRNDKCFGTYLTSLYLLELITSLVPIKKKITSSYLLEMVTSFVPITNNNCFGTYHLGLPI